MAPSSGHTEKVELNKQVALSNILHSWKFTLIAHKACLLQRSLPLLPPGHGTPDCF